MLHEVRLTKWQIVVLFLVTYIPAVSTMIPRLFGY